nr:rho GDP-dissociation inhibitor 1-like [Ipomoea batatas]GME16279.1 rho GDP-dissociation inhibitor 1-like [Ipomoea batatas]
MGGSDHEKKDGREVPTDGDDDSDHVAKHTSDREASSYANEEDEEFVQMGPNYSIKEHLEMDKDDESLRRWKEQLLGSVEINSGCNSFSNGGSCVVLVRVVVWFVLFPVEAQEPDVKVLSLTNIGSDSPSRPWPEQEEEEGQ